MPAPAEQYDSGAANRVTHDEGHFLGGEVLSPLYQKHRRLDVV
jgi:hypothetical protein